MTNKISTFAVLDLETACLPSLNFNKCNITEISIHGFNVQNVSEAQNCDSPRITHKLTLLFNPFMRIEPESEKITGLNNESLQYESIFDANAANVILNFLKHLQQPICLVAHNGNGFDFPVLKHAFSKLGMGLPNDVLCLDSLITIKALDLAKEAEKDDNNELSIPLPELDSNIEELATPLKNNENIEEFATPLKNDEEAEKSEKENNINVSETQDTPIKLTDTPGKIESPVDWQKFNETTPRRPPNFENIERKRKRQVEEQISPAPADPISRKSLKFTPSTPSKAPSYKSYKLVTIYERLFGSPPETAHFAEADVITLEKIMLKYGKSFVDYAVENAKPFSEVKKLGAR